MADKYLIAEEAYKNGYEAGKRDAVVHAHWTTYDECMCISWQCSNCGVERMNWGPKFCPECGAKMDEPVAHGKEWKPVKCGGILNEIKN